MVAAEDWDFVVLECSMAVQSSVWNYAYTCMLTGLDLNNRDIEILVGRLHPAGKNDSDVTAVFIENSKMWFIPVELFETFPNLRTLRVAKAELKSIDQLTICPNLNYFEADANQITVLETGTFTNCPNLTSVIIRGNQIHTVNAGAFHLNSKFAEINLSNNKINAIARNFFDFTYNIAKFSLEGNICVIKSFLNITPDNIYGLKPFFEKCFRNHDKLTQYH